MSNELAWYFHQGQNLLPRTHLQFFRPTIWKNATKKIEVCLKQTKRKSGSEHKLSKCDERLIIRALHYPRKDVNFTSGLYAVLDMNIIIDRLDVRDC